MRRSIHLWWWKAAFLKLWYLEPPGTPVLTWIHDNSRCSIANLKKWQVSSFKHFCFPNPHHVCQTSVFNTLLFFLALTMKGDSFKPDFMKQLEETKRISTRCKLVVSVMGPDFSLLLWAGMAAMMFSVCRCLPPPVTRIPTSSCQPVLWRWVRWLEVTSQDANVAAVTIRAAKGRTIKFVKDLYKETLFTSENNQDHF